MSVEEDKKSSEVEVKTDLQFREGYFTPAAINPVSFLLGSPRHKHHGHTRSRSVFDQEALKRNRVIKIDDDIRAWISQHYEAEYKKATEEKQERPSVAVAEEQKAEEKKAEEQKADNEAAKTISEVLALFLQFDEFNPEIQESSNAYERIFAANLSSALSKNPRTKSNLFSSPLSIRIAYRIRELLNNVLRSSQPASQPQGFFSNVLQNQELKYDEKHGQNNFVDERTYAQITDEVPYNICARMLNQLEIYIAYFEALQAKANRNLWGSRLRWLLLLPALAILLPVAGWTLLWLSGVAKAEAINMVVSVVSPIFAGGWWSYLIDISLGLSLIIGFIMILIAYINKLDATEKQIIAANEIPPPLNRVDEFAKKAIYGRVYSVLIDYMKQCGHLKTDNYIKIKLAELNEARTPKLEQELIDSFCRLYLTPKQIREIQAGDTENRIVPGCKEQTINWAVRELKDILHTIPDFFKGLSEHRLTEGQIQQIKALAKSQLSILQKSHAISNTKTSKQLLAQEMRAYEAVLKNFDRTFHRLEALEQKELEGRIKAFNSKKIDESTLHIIPDFFKGLSEHRLTEDQIRKIRELVESNLMRLKQMRSLPNIQVSRPLLAQEITAYEAVLKNFDKMFPVIDLERQTLDDKIKFFKETKIEENKTHWWDIIARLQVWQITQAQLVGRSDFVDRELGQNWLSTQTQALNPTKHRTQRSRSIDISHMFAASASIVLGSNSVLTSASNIAEPVVDSKEEADSTSISTSFTTVASTSSASILTVSSSAAVYTDTPPSVLTITAHTSSISSGSLLAESSMSSASALTMSQSSTSATAAPQMVVISEETEIPNSPSLQSMTFAQFSKRELKARLGEVGTQASQDTISEETEEDIEHENSYDSKH
ncbi:MAG: hypothetical protein M1561_01570 [Gammaproteobacteria bacterium]|nr:hypothetical protein [Gammaproteobacteria bacterium]